MYYSIKGGKKSEKELVIKALWFAKDYLLPRHKHIEVDIELKKNIKCDADVVSGDEYREYIMRIRRGLKEDDILTSVFHEFVHIKQDVRKEHALFECSDTPYLERAWEVEAFDLQETMLTAYRKEEKQVAAKKSKKLKVKNLTK
tara:strand:- start:1069 stop:1500 length:432 start_codon:yes stop_codon:yes gene_type:complete